MTPTERWKTIAVSAAILVIAAPPAFAQSDASRIDELERQADAMLEQIAKLRAELEQAKEQEATPDLQGLRADTVAARQVAQRAEAAASEWKDVTSVTHLSGYASADFTNTSSAA